MTCTYKGHTYGHQQIWALVEALAGEEINVVLRRSGEAGNNAPRWLAQLYDRRTCQYFRAHGDPGDRSPFRALCRAVEELHKRETEG